MYESPTGSIACTSHQQVQCLYITGSYHVHQQVHASHNRYKTSTSHQQVPYLYESLTGTIPVRVTTGTMTVRVTNRYTMLVRVTDSYHASTSQ